jgi:ATP-dependent 26S proteasome regulatory subunit
MIVVEDVDLIAGERMLPGRDTNPLLFQLLNEMDGLAEDCDVIFVLTTNRLELLEPALAARPGRIDQAVEIKLPDAGCRRRLLELYLGDVPTSEIELAPVVDATAGVSAAFIRELIRRAVLAAATEGDGNSDAGSAGARETRAPTVEARHLTTSLDTLTATQAPVLRTLLGATRPPT